MPQQLKPKHAVACDDAEPVVDGMAVVQHEPQLPARLQHAANLCQRRAEIRHVRQNSPRPDEVERCIREWQMRRITLHRRSMPSIERQSSRHRPDARPGQVERGEPRPMARELPGDRAEPASNFEHALSTQGGVVDQRGEERRIGRLREPRGAPELAIDALEKRTRGPIFR